MNQYETSFMCEYLDLSQKPSSDMLYKCIQVPAKGFDFNCQGDPDTTDRKNTSYTDNSAIQRGFVTSLQGITGSSDQGQDLNQGQKGPKGQKSYHNWMGDEGFSNYFVTDNGPGESTVRDGKCPEGYTRDKTGKCIQVCTNCSYRDGMKSKEFNEADPCFPNGVYDGVDQNGIIKCTCGSDNQYCSDRSLNQFTADGSLSLNNKIKKSIGLTDSVSKLFYFGQL